VDGVPTYRLDLAYPHARVAVEYDGEAFHTSDEDRAADRKRRTWLRDHGWTVIVVDKNSFTEEAVNAWVAELRAALGMR
jgi:very-short-patch-repair endonuclease